MQFPDNNPGSNTTDQMSGGLPHVNATESNLLNNIGNLLSITRAINASNSSENNASSQPIPRALTTMQPPPLLFQLAYTMVQPTYGTNLPTPPTIPLPYFPRSLQAGFTSYLNLVLFNTTHGGILHPSAFSNHISSNSSTMNLPPISGRLPRPSCRRRYYCNQCGEAFLFSRVLTQHTLQIHNHFRCSLCNATFTQMANLQRHSLKHWHCIPFRCKICSKGYRRKDHLVNHITNTHPNADPRLNIIALTCASECFRYLEFQHFRELQMRRQGGNNSTLISPSGKGWEWEFRRS
nr:hypothetical transcript [Hymenolepis microstoma]